MKATEMKVEQGLGVGITGWRKEEVFVMHFFCSGITQNLSFVSMSDRQSDRETCVEASGYEW